MSDLGIGFIDILPRSDAFTKTLTTQMQGAFGKVQSSVTGFAKSLTGAQLGLAALGAVAVGAISKGIKATQEWAAQVRTLQRVTGTSAESTSALAAAGEVLGLSTEKLNTGFGILDKNIINNSANLLKYGVALRDANGDALPFDEVLANLSDKFKTLEPGAEQAAFAMNAFGRSGKEMIPLLGKTSEEMATLAEEAQRAGLIMSQSELVQAKNLSVAQRQLGEAFKGASIQIGKQFIPAMTELTETFTKFATKVAPIVADVLTPVADALIATADGVSALLDLIPQADVDVGNAQKNLDAWGENLTHIATGVQKGNLSLDEAADKYTAYTDATALANGLSIDAVDAETKHANALVIVTGAVERLGTETEKAAKAVDHWAGLTRKDLVAWSDEIITSFADTFTTLGSTVKDTFSTTPKELQRAFDQMLAITIRFKRDEEALLALKPGTFGLNKTDMQAFEKYLLDQGPATVDAFVRSTVAGQQHIVDTWAANVQKFNALTAGIKDGTVHVKADTSPAKYTIDNFIAAEGQRIITIGVQAKNRFATGGVVPGFAAGGSTDTIPAMLSPGEFVMRRKAVDQIGLPTLQAMNAGGQPVSGPQWVQQKPQKMDGALRIYDWRNGLATLDAEIGWEDAVRTR